MDSTRATINSALHRFQMGGMRLGWMGCIIAFVISSCAPATPFVSSPTPQPTGQVSTTDSVNAKATEAAIIGHVFATLTASAPKATLLPTTAPTTPFTPFVIRSTPTFPPPPTSVPRLPNTPTPAPVTPKPTVDPYLSQVPRGSAGILVVSYIGKQANFSIAGSSYFVDPNGKRLIIVPPGTHTFSVNIVGLAGGSWSDVIELPGDQYKTYTLSPRQ